MKPEQKTKVMIEGRTDPPESIRWVVRARGTNPKKAMYATKRGWTHSLWDAEHHVTEEAAVTVCVRIRDKLAPLDTDIRDVHIVPVRIEVVPT